MSVTPGKNSALRTANIYGEIFGSERICLREIFRRNLPAHASVLYKLKPCACRCSNLMNLCLTVQGAQLFRCKNVR